MHWCKSHHMVYVLPTSRPFAFFYFNALLFDPQADHLTRHINHLRTCFSLASKRRDFKVVDAVILPDQLHMVWKIDDPDFDTKAAWQQVKSSFSRHLPAETHVTQAQKNRREKGIWQRGFWEHRLSDHADYLAHREYMWRLPVAMGHVDRPTDWKFSSIHRDMARQSTARSWSNQDKLLLDFDQGTQITVAKAG